MTKHKFEVQVWNPYSNLHRVFQTFECEDIDKCMEDEENNCLEQAILTLSKKAKEAKHFFGQVWEIEPENRLHYEINK